jgi:hypothetical protein
MLIPGSLLFIQKYASYREGPNYMPSGVYDPFPPASEWHQNEQISLSYVGSILEKKLSFYFFMIWR